MERAIFHSDINHCYAQIEEMNYPELRKVPMAVGGHEEERHGIILAKNDEAKKWNIKTGETLREARAKCPDLLIIPPHYEDYIYYTEKVKDIYREYSNQIESFGLDEAWIDYTESRLLFGDPVETAKTIQKRVLEELGLTISIGVSFNKIFAKLGSDLIKPSGLVVITNDNYKEIVWPLPVEDLLYVGRSTKKKLSTRGIRTIGELANYPLPLLKEFLGKMGEVLHDFANGEDQSEVTKSTFKREVKSVGNSVTAIHDINNFEELKIVYTVLCESVASRLKEIGMCGNVISVGLRTINLESFTRQKKISEPTNISEEIIDVVLDLVSNNYDFSIPLRSIGVAVSNLSRDTGRRQLSLFHDEDKIERARRMDLAMDEIRNRFGFSSICRCSTKLDENLTNFNPKGDHTIHPVGYF